jgi:hypothetical protein
MAGYAAKLAAMLGIDGKALHQGSQIGIRTTVELGTVLVQEDHALSLAGGADSHNVRWPDACLADALPTHLTNGIPENGGVELPAQRSNFRRRIILPLAVSGGDKGAAYVENQGSTTARPGIYGEDILARRHLTSTLGD